MAGERPLKAMATAFGRLATDLSRNGGAVSLAHFAQACAHVSVLFGCLGFAFKFAEKDYTAKVDDLLNAAKEFDTLESVLESDMENNSVRRGGSHSRNLLRVKRGIEMVKLLFDNILESEDAHLRNSASKAYEAVFARHHNWAIRKAVAAGTYALPSKSQFLATLNEDGGSARVQMLEYVAGVAPLLGYIDNLFLSRNIGIDW